LPHILDKVELGRISDTHQIICDLAPNLVMLYIIGDELFKNLTI